MEQFKKDLIYLMYCAANEQTPDKAKVAAMDLDRLYDTAKKHSIRSVLYVPLEAAGAADERFSQAYNKSVRKNILLDIKRKSLLDEFESRGIWYLPMKGCILKDLYPSPGMREMTDNDILFDGSHREEVRDLMTGRGYDISHFGTGHCDQYTKPPVLNFELHVCLFTRSTSEKMWDYYSDISRLLIKDPDNSFGHHLSDEDFYIYMTAHEFKHYTGGGTGIRSLLDCYVFIRQKADSLDWDYIRQEAGKMGFAEHEKARRELAFKLFSRPEVPELTAEEEEMLDQFLDYGAFGTVSRFAESKVRKFTEASEKNSSAGFILKRLFPPVSEMKRFYPICRKSPLLIPAAYVMRMIKGITEKKAMTSAELKAAIRHKKQ